MPDAPVPAVVQTEGVGRSGTIMATAVGLMASGPVEPPVRELAWFSDHQGVQADLGLACEADDAPGTPPSD
jgi:hypothetical protein